MIAMGYTDPNTGLWYPAAADVSGLPAAQPRDYSLANTIITGVVDITQSILGVVAIAAQPDPAAPGVPMQTVYMPSQGMTTPGMIAIGVPIAIVALVMFTRKG